MKELWNIDCSHFNDNIVTENGIIVDCMPLLQKFKGQPVGNLTGWANKVFGKVTVEQIE
jgi:hypothetical protein